MIKNNYSSKIIESGIKYGKYKSTALTNLSNKIRNTLYEYTSKKDVPKLFCYENTNKPKENYYRLNLPRECKNGKVLILQSINEYKKIDNYFNAHIMNPLLLFFGSSFLFSVYNVNSLFILASVFSGVFSLLKANKLVGYHNIIVDSIYLKSCGKIIIINTLTRNLEADILKVRKIRMTEIYFYKKIFDHLEEEFIPIVADYEVFLIPKSLDYVDKEVLFAISHSCYLENN